MHNNLKFIDSKDNQRSIILERTIKTISDKFAFNSFSLISSLLKTYNLDIN